jgi:hypothetical protein
VKPEQAWYAGRIVNGAVFIIFAFLFFGSIRAREHSCVPTATSIDRRTERQSRTREYRAPIGGRDEARLHRVDDARTLADQVLTLVICSLCSFLENCWDGGHMTMPCRVGTVWLARHAAIGLGPSPEL